MNIGYIKIKETSHQKFIVEARLVDGNLWITKHEIADLFNVPVGMVSNNLCAIFRSGVLREEDAIRGYLFERNGKCLALGPGSYIKERELIIAGHLKY